jgi:serine/threonine protein kinase
MAIATVASFVDALRQYRLLEPAHLDQLGHDSSLAGLEPKAIAKALIQRGWLTPYQINQVFQGRGSDLVLGSYVLLERLGEGGMGTVFKARNWKLGQIVAVKVIRKQRLAIPDAVRRFYREIQAAAQLSHPNVVRAYDADLVGDAHFFAMEFVDGRDLQKLVQRHGPMPIAQACNTIRQAALGLQHASERGLVHRDIKPANLLLTNTGGTVKILDMGLARVNRPDSEPNGRDTLTEASMVMGTLDYIAPEQAMNSRIVDCRADLYSLGCTFYYVLTGQVPFPGCAPLAKLLCHRCEEPRPLEELRPNVPAPVAAIVRRLMAKRPEDRFQSPGALAAALAVVLAGATCIPYVACTPPAIAAIPTDPLCELNTLPPNDFAAALAEDGSELPSTTQRRALRRKKKIGWIIVNIAGATVVAGLVSLLVYLLKHSR